MNTIYEVVRVIRNQPIFLEDHLERMQESLHSFDQNKALDTDLIDEQVKHMALSGDTINFNLRVEYHLEEERYEFHEVKGVYPTVEQERDGVKVVTFPYMRDNPNVKVYDMDLRNRMQAKKEQYGAFEILYIHEDRVFETSKANIFFIKGDTVVTAPDDLVLKGVTRKKTLELCEQFDIPVEKRQVYVEELDTFDAAFLSGTSIHLLPIQQIDDRQYPAAHPLWKKLSRAYKYLIVDDLDKVM